VVRLVKLQESAITVVGPDPDRTPAFGRVAQRTILIGFAVLNRPSAKSVDRYSGSGMGFLPWYAWVPVSGTAADIHIFMWGRGVGVGSDRDTGPTIMVARDVSDADILEPTVCGRRMDKYSVFAEAAYIEAVDQNVAILPVGRNLDPNATSVIVLTAAADNPEIAIRTSLRSLIMIPGPSPASIVAGACASEEISIGVSPAVTQIGPRCTSPDLSFVS